MCEKVSFLFTIVYFIIYCSFVVVAQDTGTGPSTGEGTVPAPPQTCTGNQTLVERGYDCATCRNLSGACPLKEQTKCYCNLGYVRVNETNCILPKDCGSTCRRNETYSDLGFDCHNCNNFAKLICPVLREKRCFCIPGYVRNDTGYCIDSGECPTYMEGQCQINQTYSSSGYDCVTCANYKYTTSCNLSRTPKCYCNPGFVRDELAGKCVFPEDCLDIKGGRCSVNETFADYGFDCATCSNFRTAVCRADIAAKCYCKPGYVRNQFNTCVVLSDCPNSIITPPTVTDERCANPASLGCRNGCIKTCSNRNYYNYQPCPPICRECACPIGQVRDDVTGRCIAIEQCITNPYVFPNYATNYNYRFN